MTDDLKPLPKWKQRVARARAYWKRTANRRQEVYSAFKPMVRKAVTLAISGTGATLISYGVWSVFQPAGYAVAGLLLWAIQWNYGSERGDG
jgi:hypothetical protein